MLSIDYDILRLFSSSKEWTVGGAAAALDLRLTYAATRFAALLKQCYLWKVPKKRNPSLYGITETGRQVLDEARYNPVLQNPYPWINRARAGINTEGRELNLKGRAAIPCPEPIEKSYEMDLDAFIDAKRAGLLDDILRGVE